jgi:hypothetical protein
MLGRRLKTVGGGDWDGGGDALMHILGKFLPIVKGSVRKNFPKNFPLLRLA